MRDLKFRGGLVFKNLEGLTDKELAAFITGVTDTLDLLEIDYLCGEISQDEKTYKIILS